ncbi:MAG: Molybdenum-pterin-binding protein MopA [Alphaproteobacteria bacterium MarineAlpha11_Bin1]|nr:MAG: Molybdenum-pterin-binding protein MopA [Alphaproteobacteria bacterium MarineAlpha11_Bin1]|tara:strand:- start:5013 stop:5384 length:372 start_codon:yes stop_codon:yes gene_type:complete
MRPQIPSPHVRVLLGKTTTIGPGKAELLQLIEETGSISAAARKMSMSYRRAWTLVETMNGAFRQPLVETASGGRGGGGARVTDYGHEALRLYRLMEKQALSSVRTEMEAFSELLNPDHLDVKS